MQKVKPGAGATDVVSMLLTKHGNQDDHVVFMKAFKRERVQRDIFQKRMADIAKLGIEAGLPEDWIRKI